jgi:hypothetical protein
LLQGNNPGEAQEVQLSAEIPSRQQQVQRLAASKPYRQQQNPFDVLIIGGGATGAGIAVDAATRYDFGPLSPVCPVTVGRSLTACM